MASSAGRTYQRTYIVGLNSGGFVLVPRTALRYEEMENGTSENACEQAPEDGRSQLVRASQSTPPF